MFKFNKSPTTAAGGPIVAIIIIFKTGDIKINICFRNINVF